MSKRSIPRPQTGADPALLAMKENMEVLMGQRGGKLDKLPATAPLADVIAKINEVIDRLQ